MSSKTLIQFSLTLLAVLAAGAVHAGDFAKACYAIGERKAPSNDQRDRFMLELSAMCGCAETKVSAETRESYIQIYEDAKMPGEDPRVARYKAEFSDNHEMSYKLLSMRREFDEAAKLCKGDMALK